MSAAVLRLKRKASSEPIEGLVIALKKSKEYDSNEVFFKFAATVKSDTDSIKEHIQAALSKEKESKLLKWRDPKGAAVRQKNVSNICEKLRNECKAVSEKKRLEYLNNRRLIFTETVPILDDDKESPVQSAEVRDLFHLYDIIEENEEPKKQLDDGDNTITCNGTPLIREKVSDYVYDVYVANGQFDNSFVENAVSLRPCTVTNEDLYFGDSDDNSEVYEDEDDSNDESNWRNEYPEDEESGADQESEEFDENRYYNEIRQSFNHVSLGDCSDEEPFHYSKVMHEIEDEYGNDYSD
ncbi:probable RNA polymerase II nuclear localization protein SLC7A6OS [Parasteatoda tepidariorum]|nr:probable RNA polymerase II nuclear localization protein SLC7A6OS [Parasteatoda tepidariorum]